jgi:hypothetical protein
MTICFSFLVAEAQELFFSYATVGGWKRKKTGPPVKLTRQNIRENEREMITKHKDANAKKKRGIFLRRALVALYLMMPKTTTTITIIIIKRKISNKIFSLIILFSRSYWIKKIYRIYVCICLLHQTSKTSYIYILLLFFCFSNLRRQIVFCVFFFLWRRT